MLNVGQEETRKPEHVVLTHLWPLVWQAFHYLWSSVERTSTVCLQQTAPLEMIGKPKVCQLWCKKTRGHKLIVICAL